MGPISAGLRSERGAFAVRGIEGRAGAVWWLMMGRRTSDVFVIGEEGLLADRDLGVEVPTAELAPTEESKGDWLPFDDEAGPWASPASRVGPRLNRRLVVAVAAIVLVGLVVSRAVSSATSGASPVRSAGAARQLVSGASVQVSHRSVHEPRPVSRRPRRGEGGGDVGTVVHLSKESAPARRRSSGSVGVRAGAPKEREPVDEAAPSSAPAEAPLPEPAFEEPLETMAPWSPGPVAEGGGPQASGEEFGFER